MKSTGIVRKIDELGRIVIPIELRRTLDIGLKDPIEIFMDEEHIILKKYKPYMACQMTGEISEKNLLLASGKIVVSKEGAEKLMKELEQFVVRQ